MGFAIQRDNLDIPYRMVGTKKVEYLDPRNGLCPDVLYRFAKQEDRLEGEKFVEYECWYNNEVVWTRSICVLGNPDLLISYWNAQNFKTWKYRIIRRA